MRRLPIYFLIDVSESMVGEPIQQVEEGLGMIVKELKTDPYALETVYISVIVFAGKARTVVPLTDIISFYPPKMPIGGGTSLGTGLQHLVQEMDVNIQKTTMERKGDWKPIVFLFTDGAPTDDASNALKVWKAKWASRSNMVAVSFGRDTDMGILNQLTETVLTFNNTDTASYKQFFKWITASIQASSQSVSMYSKDEIQLAKRDDAVVEKYEPGQAEGSSQQSGKVDTNVATFIGKCQSTHKPYLIKYQRLTESKEMFNLKFDSSGYRLAGAYPVGNDYFELSDGSAQQNTVNTDELMGFPACPSCGNQFGFSLCACGGIFCIGRTGINKCPWCHRESDFQFGEGSADVRRTRG